MIPEAIRAVDRDSMNATIRYSFVNGTPAFFGDYFRIDSVSGAVKQLAPVDRTRAKAFDIVVKAEQDSPSRRFATARLHIDVLPVDKNPPTLTPSSYHGYVDENSPLGTTVSADRQSGGPLRILVRDADIVSESEVQSHLPLLRLAAEITYLAYSRLLPLSVIMISR